MAAQRKREDHRPPPPAPSPRPALAGPAAAVVDSPVHDHLARLEASFSEGDGLAPYPRAVRLAIMVGAPAVLWGLVIVSIGTLARLAGA